MAIGKVEQIRSLLNSIETGDPGPVEVVNEAKYIQHNPQTHEGSDGLAVLFKKLSQTNPRVNMVRGFEDGEYVFAHMEYDFSSRKICFEVFRFEDGRAVEHWDNIQERTGPNSSGHSMVDGETEATEQHLTEINRQKVRNFIKKVMLENNIGATGKFVHLDRYVEHNPDCSDDLEKTLGDRLRANEQGTPQTDYQTIHRVLAQGNFVLSVCEGARDNIHTSFYDLFRLENGKIVEHWDTTEKVAPKSEWKNSNGKF